MGQLSIFLSINKCVIWTFMQAHIDTTTHALKTVVSRNWCVHDNYCYNICYEFNLYMCNLYRLIIGLFLAVYKLQFNKHWLV